MRYIFIFLLLVFVGHKTTACGTVKIWANKYFDATNEEQKLDALKFMNCDPVIKEFKTTRDTYLLVKTMRHARLWADSLHGANNDSLAEYVQHLLTKMFLRFKVYQFPDSAVVEQWHSYFSTAYGIELERWKMNVDSVLNSKGMHAILLDDHLGEPHLAYANYLKKEMRVLIRN
ncbi:MAG: hypothetical protein KDC92_14650 [Bacteroidetes bacterium]|nr:hypothetical protein [Bacteroidota bacterium]